MVCNGLQVPSNIFPAGLLASYLLLMANACCSIEMEPKTLNHGQLHQAREVAADVVQKLEPSEASVVFIDGLRPVTLVKEKQTTEEGVGSEEQHDCTEEGGKEKEAQDYDGRRCQCSRVSNANTESPDQLQQLTQPLSAPF